METRGSHGWGGQASAGMWLGADIYIYIYIYVVRNSGAIRQAASNWGPPGARLGRETPLLALRMQGCMLCTFLAL
jgi:hypothetical protein